MNPQTTIDAFDLVRAFVAGAVLVLMARLLHHYWNEIKQLCRFGIALIGAGIILTVINSILGPETPFQDWAFIMFLIGLGAVFYEFGCAVCEGKRNDAA